MAYKPNYATGDLIDVTIWQELVNRAIYIFADSTARDNASTGITSPTEGQFCYLLDTGGGSGGLQYYNGSSWANTSLTSDITGVLTASNSGLAGGVTSGDANLVVDPSNLADGSSVTVDTANDLLILEDVTDGTVYKVKPSQIASGSANALEDGDSDFTISDGLTNGIHYELDNTDVANWNNAGVQLLADGGIFHNALTQNQSYTVASTAGAVAVGALSVVGTITVAGNLVVL